MRDVKCINCAEYRNNWCEKITDSPHPRVLRDCQYWHERKDTVEVVLSNDFADLAEIRKELHQLNLNIKGLIKEIGKRR